MYCQDHNSFVGCQSTANKSTKPKCENSPHVNLNGNCSVSLAYAVPESVEKKQDKTERECPVQSQLFYCVPRLTTSRRNIYYPDFDACATNIYRAQAMRTNPMLVPLNNPSSSPWAQELSKYRKSAMEEKCQFPRPSYLLLRANSISSQKFKMKYNHRKPSNMKMESTWPLSKEHVLGAFPRQVYKMASLKCHAPNRKIWRGDKPKVSNENDGDLKIHFQKEKEIVLGQARLPTERSAVKQKNCAHEPKFDANDSNTNPVKTIKSTTSTYTSTTLVPQEVDESPLESSREGGGNQIPEPFMPRYLQNLINCWHSPINIEGFQALNCIPNLTKIQGRRESVGQEVSKPIRRKFKIPSSFSNDDIESAIAAELKNRKLSRGSEVGSTNEQQSSNVSRVIGGGNENNESIGAGSSTMKALAPSATNIRHPTPSIAISPTKNGPKKSSYRISPQRSNANFFILQKPANILPGILAKHELPKGDDSNLFLSVNFLLTSGDCESFDPENLRQIAVEEIESDHALFNKELLGKSNKKYCDQLRRPNSSAGIVELYVLSHYFCIEIDVLDTRCAVVRRFGDDRHYQLRVFLFYDGEFFEPLYLTTGRDEAPITIFPVDECIVFKQAKRLVRAMKYSPRYANLKVNNLPWRCMDCRLDLKGLQQAEQHLILTGHFNFSVL